MAIEIHVDGSSTLNPRCAGWASVLLAEGKKPVIFYGHLEGGTNNVGELFSNIVGFSMLKMLNKPVTLFTDSKYSKGVLSGETTAVVNFEIVELGKSVLSQIPKCNLSYKWEKGHSGIFGNDLADKFAKMGRNKKEILFTPDYVVKYFESRKSVEEYILSVREMKCQ